VAHFFGPPFGRWCVMRLDFTGLTIYSQ